MAAYLVPLWTGGEQGLDGFRQSGCRTLAHEQPDIRGAYDFGRPPDIGGDDRRAAGHAFEQYVGPAFAARAEQQNVGGAVPPLEFTLRDHAGESHALRHAQTRDQRFERGMLGTGADDSEVHVGRQQRQSFDGDMVTLALDQMADGQQLAPVGRQTEALAGNVTRLRRKPIQLDAIEEDSQLSGLATAISQRIHERLAHA